jgi:uncharacterized membrane protein
VDDLFALFLLLLLVLFLGSVFGLIAFFRLAGVSERLRAAEAKLAQLEQMLRARSETPAPPPQAAPQPAAPPPAPQPSAPPAAAVRPARRPALAGLERMVAANWFVWLGGALIALAIVYLLRFAIERGVFGPPAQLAGAYLLGAGLFAGAEWARRAPSIAQAKTQVRRLPAILAGAALFAFFAATYAGYANFKLLDVRWAFVLMALASLAGLFIALRYGRALAAIGLAGGYLAPALVQAAAPSATALFGYLLFLSACALATIRLRRWRGFVWLVGAGALMWSLIWLDRAAPGSEQTAAAVYLVLLAALGFAFAWDEARAPLKFQSWWNVRAAWTESALAAHVIAAAALLALVALADRAGYPLAVLLALAAACALTCAAAFWRDGFALAPLGAAALALLALSGWPFAAPGAPVREGEFFAVASALAFVFSAGGWLVMVKGHVKGPGATLAALGPLSVLLISHEKAEALRSPVLWSGMALLLALLNAGALQRVARAYGGVDKTPGPSAAFALGASAGAILTILFALRNQPLWAPTALTLLAPSMAWLDLRFRLPALRAAIGVITLIALWALGPSFSIFDYTLAPAPIVNALLPVYGVAIAALWSAASLYRAGGVSADARVVQALEASVLVLAAFGLAMEVRHIATGGEITAARVSLAEVGADAIAWLGVAIGLAARFGPQPRRVIFWGEAAFAALAGLTLLFVAVLFANPWWGDAPSPTAGPAVFNTLLVAYGIPGALFAVYAIIQRRRGLALRATAAGLAATVLLFVNLTLEVRRLYHPQDMAGPDVGAWEAWSLTAAWICFAAALWALGLIRGKPSLRYSSVVVLILSIIKALGFDLAALDGVLRVALLLGLGVAALAVAWTYQKLVAPRAAGDPNIMPPR